MQEMLNTFLQTIFCSPLKTVGDALLMDITQNNTEGGFAEAWKFVGNVYNDVLLPIGIMLMVIYFISSLIEKSSAGQFNFEVFFKCFIQLIIAALLVSNLMTIVNAVLSIGYGLIDKVADVNTATFNNQFYEDAFNSVKEEFGNILGIDVSNIPVLGDIVAIVNVGLNPSKMIQLITSLLVPYIMSLIIRLGTMLLAYTRVIELMITTMMMPLCMGDIFTEGIHGAAMKNIKRLFAVSLQGFAMYSVAALYSHLSAGMLGSIADRSWSELVFSSIVLGAACLMSMFKASQFCKEAIGVH